MSEKRNPIAAALRSPHLRQQTVASKKGYNRKPRSKPSWASDVFSLFSREVPCPI